MGISTQSLMKERFVLQKTFSELNGKIQQVEKLIKIDAESGRNDGTQAQVEGSVPAPSLDIKPKEEAQLLNEKDK